MSGTWAGIRGDKPYSEYGIVANGILLRHYCLGGKCPNILRLWYEAKDMIRLRLKLVCDYLRII